MLNYIFMPNILKSRKKNNNVVRKYKIQFEVMSIRQLTFGGVPFTTGVDCELTSVVVVKVCDDWTLLIVAARAARRFSSFVLPTSGVACCWAVCTAEVGDAGTLRIIVLLKIQNLYIFLNYWNMYIGVLWYRGSWI